MSFGSFLMIVFAFRSHDAEFRELVAEALKRVETSSWSG